MSQDTHNWKEVGGQSQLDMWDENAEKSIEGLYVNMRTKVGKNNSNMYETKLDNGSVKGVWGSTVLDSRMASIPVGSFIKIVFNGKTAGKDARGAYKSYTVYMDETDATPSPTKTVGAEESKSDIPF